jgi:hypothetical protein
MNKSPHLSQFLNFSNIIQREIPGQNVANRPFVLAGPATIWLATKRTAWKSDITGLTFLGVLPAESCWRLMPAKTKGNVDLASI